jgi:hypothetical protein
MNASASPARVWLTTAVLIIAAAIRVTPQSAPRIATSLDLLLKFPGFFHSRVVALIASPVETDGVWRIPIDAPRTLLVVPRTGTPPSRASELRGTFVDVARLMQTRELSVFPSLTSLTQSLYADREPARGTVFALAEANWTEPPDATPPSLRAVVLDPASFEGKTLTLRGRFRGQNLFGDLPVWPRQSRWDFVLQAADASMWVTGLRPRGKGFDLDPTSKRSTGIWLEVTGTLRVEASVPRLEATTLAQSEPEAEEAAEPVIAPPAQPPPSIIFSAPLDGERDVPPATEIRVQFSRDMAPDSFTDHIGVAYGPETSDKMPAFTATYQAGNRGLVIEFAGPLVRGASVHVDFRAGITATDGTPLAPAALGFTVSR